jgi:hypothetical protein
MASLPPGWMMVRQRFRRDRRGQVFFREGAESPRRHGDRAGERREREQQQPKDGAGAARERAACAEPIPGGSNLEDAEEEKATRGEHQHDRHSP